MRAIHPLKRRLLAEEFVRLRRADEPQRYVASQRRGRIDPNPHQIDALVFALRRIPDGGCILADEVGLGKTIEAGLVMAQLLAEGMRRILLIVPKSLLGQWQTELYSHFGIEAREGRSDPEAFVGDGVFVVHREFAGGDRGCGLLRTSDPFDLVVIDEAHEVFATIYKRYDKDGNYDDEADEAQMADRVRSLVRPLATPVLLLTATPIQNSLAELWGLIQYVEPTGLLLGTLPTFREVFCEKNGKDRSLVKGQEFELRRRLASVLQRTLRNQAQEFLKVPFVERQANLIEYSMKPEEQALYQDVTLWLMDPYLCSFGGKNRRLLLIGFHRRMASSLTALASSLKKVAERLRKRIAGSEDGSSDDLLSEFASDLEDEFEDLEEPLTDEQAHPLSPDPPSENRMLAELERIENFIERATSIPRESKADCLLEALKVIAERAEKGEGTGKVVIFTESLQTQDFLYGLITANGYLPEDVTLFRGQNQGPRVDQALGRWQDEEGHAIPAGHAPSRPVAIRMALVHEFARRSKVFISTEAGAKGLNLQFCETLINYDLPWNPQRIEQRIGRVHRYGQKRGVTILTFLDRGNEAQQLTFDLLSKKLDLFGKVLGAADVVLHAPTSDFPEPLVWGLAVDFETQLRRIYSQARSLDEITARLRALRESMAAKRLEFENEHRRMAELIETRLGDSVKKAFRDYQQKLPASLDRLDRDLDDITGAFLEAAGVSYERDQAVGRIVYRVAPSPELPDGYREGGTFVIGHTRDLSEGDPLHSGHSLVRAAIDEARRATSGPISVEFAPGPDGLPECLGALVGKRGRLVVTKVAHRGIEPVEHLVYTAMLEHQTAPLERSLVERLLALSVHDLKGSESPPCIAQGALDEAVEEAVLRDQPVTAREDQDRAEPDRFERKFERKLERLDRYLGDRILVLKRKRTGLDRKLEEADRRARRAVTPSNFDSEGAEVRRLQKAIQEAQGQIDRLERGDDNEYKQLRDGLYERRYQRPTVDEKPILVVDFRVVGGAAC